jgi:Class II flagellar assembly regulator
LRQPDGGRQIEAAMKISHAGPPAGPGQPRRAGGRPGDAAAGEFTRYVDTRSSAPRNVPPATPLAGLGGMLAIQEVPDAAADRRRAVRRGHGLLDELQELQLGLIEGRLSDATLRGLAARLEETRPALDDPKLASLLDQIEIRAAIEMAKLRRDRA